MKKSPPSQQDHNRSGPAVAAAVESAKPRGASRKVPRKGRAKVKQPAALLEEHVPKAETRSVQFAYFDPEASEVFLAGTFNDWKARTTPMVKISGDKWCTELRLKPGRYEYRLVVDGRWQDDPMAARFVANSFGGLNCVVDVKAAKPATASQP
jgi:1,4-alpha-glucan branching enzyme